MLIDQNTLRKNRNSALIASSIILVLSLVAGWFHPGGLVGLLVALLYYHLVRRQAMHRWRVIHQPFPEDWKRALVSHVEFYRALNEEGKTRFQNMMKVFLDETPITGVRTDVDEQTRALVGASAVIPVFGFDDWEYSGLGEILIYPSAFNDEYQTGPGGRTLGMIGVNHLSGVMILSKSDLLSGFTNSKDKRNVGIHEFAHLVDKADGSVDGIPLGIPMETARPWIEWVGKDLATQPDSTDHIDDYAYTNEAEYFAVLSEYFFEAPQTLKRKNPHLYQMMESIYRQNTHRLLGSGLQKSGKRIGRNAPCPCGSNQKFKRCCGARRKVGMPHTN